jgi:transposase
VDARTREELIAENALLREKLASLEAEVEMLRGMLSGGGNGSSAVPFVKPNRKERRKAERAQRKKRKQSFARKRDTPTEKVEHTVDVCPDCGRRLSGGWVHSRRQVIEVPQTPVRVVEHVLIARHCGVCGKRYIPKLDLSHEVVGNSRFGVRLMSLVADMATNARMPHRTIQRMLGGLYGLNISVGEISKLLQRVADRGKPAYADLLQKIRASGVVNGDETGWRENGVNGYIWSFSTPNDRYLLRDPSRAKEVVSRTLGEEFSGVLVSDFYGAYNVYEGVKQRCWVHLLRDLKHLQEKHPDNCSVVQWVGRIKSIYEEAKAVARSDLEQMERCRMRQRFEARMLRLATPYLKAEKAPQRVLAKRIESFLGELFPFVDCEGVPSDNNAAERAVRPAVIARKVSGGTRSTRGSNTRMILMSLFGTWNLNGLDPLTTCMAMLTAPA